MARQLSRLSWLSEGRIKKSPPLGLAAMHSTENHRLLRKEATFRNKNGRKAKVAIQVDFKDDLTKTAEIGALARKILAEEHPRTRKTALERLLEVMIRHAMQGSFKHTELFLNYAWRRPIAQNLNLNATADIN